MTLRIWLAPDLSLPLCPCHTVLIIRQCCTTALVKGMQGRREEQVFMNPVLPAMAALFCTPFPTAAIRGSRSRVARARYAVRDEGYLLLGHVTKLISDAYLLSGSSVTWRKCFRQCLGLLAGMHLRPDILVLPASCQKIPVSSAELAHLGIFFMDKDGEPAQTGSRCGLSIHPGSRIGESFCAQ